MQGFGYEATRRYLSYCGMNAYHAAHDSRNPTDEPREELGGESVSAFHNGMDNFFNTALSDAWAAGPNQSFMSPVRAVLPEVSSGEPGVIVGLTGERECGKSVIGDHLVNNKNFVRLHPFNPGKAFLRGYYVSFGISEKEAFAMTDGELKNSPSPILPIDPETGEHYSSRWLMERLGRYMAREMGVKWTIGAEIRHYSAQDPTAGLLIESLVYEEDVVREMGGVIIRVTRHPDVANTSKTVGEVSDSFVAGIRHDAELINHMDGKERLIEDFEHTLSEAISAKHTVPEI